MGRWNEAGSIECMRMGITIPFFGKENIMPGRDGSGPMGMGPMTGRGAGFCAGRMTYGVPGRGMGSGGGWGRRNRCFAGREPGWGRFAGWDAPPPTPDMEKDALRREAEALKARMNAIERRLTEMNAPEGA